VSSLGRSLSLELAPERIRVNSVAAGIVETALTEELRRKVGQTAWQSIEAEHPMGIGSADDVANAVLFLLSDASRWVTGTTLVVDGGYTAH
jgi:NAD(P)-dependent dehydrogenase (short-subunit alcohol dehydrogenase family)